MNISSRANFLLASAGILWGTGGLAGALLQEQAGLHALAVAGYRLLIGGALASLGYAACGGLRQRWSLAAVLRVLVSGALLAGYQAAYYLAIGHISVSLATLITIGSVPVLVAGVTVLRERRAPGPRVLLAVGAAVAGLALLSGAPTPASGSMLAGVCLSLASGAGFTCLITINRTPVPGLRPVAVTTFGLLAGGLMLLPIALPLGMRLPLSAEVLGTAAFLGVVPTAIGYGLYFGGLAHAQQLAAALSTMLEPLTATLLSVLLLGDRLGLAGASGAALLIAALLVNHLPERARQTVPG